MGEGEPIEILHEKTVVVLFTRRRNLKLNKKLPMYKEEPKYVKEVKYLGIKFNHRLNLQEHILNRTKYCKGLLVPLCTAIAARWGPSL